MYQIKLTLPNWVDLFLKDQPKIIHNAEEQIRFVLALTERNIREKTG